MSGQKERAAFPDWCSPPSSPAQRCDASQPRNRESWIQATQPSLCPMRIVGSEHHGAASFPVGHMEIKPCLHSPSDGQNSVFTALAPRKFS